MKKAIFKYKKEDGSVSERNLINPSFLKESYNSLGSFDKDGVKYLTGIEISPEVADEREVYEQHIAAYYSEHQMTLAEYLESKGLNPKKVTLKTFKKDGVSDLTVEG